MNIKHSVVIIAYNVEKYIAEAIDSCLNQSVKPYEIIIGENCSTDSTRTILQEYEKKYPDIIKVIYHKENLGEYGNRNYLKQNVKLEGDIIHLLDGDDLFKDGMFEEMNKIILENNLDPQKERFIIVPNVSKLYLNEVEKIMLNNYKYKDYKNSMRLKIRNLFGSRNSGLSKKVYELAPLWNNTLGAWADYHHTIHLYENVDKVYFINKVFPLYRIGSGVTSNDEIELDSDSYEVDNDVNDKQYNINLSYYKVVSKLQEEDIKGKEFLDNIYLKKEIHKTLYALHNKKSDLLKMFFYKIIDLPVAFKYDGLYKYASEFIPSKFKVIIKRLFHGRF